VREACAHCLDDRFLGGEAHREEAHRPLVAVECCQLGWQQQPLGESLAELLVHQPDTFLLDHVRADPEDHAPALAERASIISRFISATARAMPSSSERPTIA
jgi:hypothetical protein